MGLVDAGELVGHCREGQDVSGGQDGGGRDEEQKDARPRSNISSTASFSLRVRRVRWLCLEAARGVARGSMLAGGIVGVSVVGRTECNQRRQARRRVTKSYGKFTRAFTLSPEPAGAGSLSTQKPSLKEVQATDLLTCRRVLT